MIRKATVPTPDLGRHRMIHQLPLQVLLQLQLRPPGRVKPLQVMILFRSPGRVVVLSYVSASASGPPDTEKVLRVLYLFAGVPRKRDMTSCLRVLCDERNWKLAMECIDIKRKPRVDLSHSKQRRKILDKVRDSCYDASLISPPCSTFSRAVWANFRGPRPVRSYKDPRGLDKLTAAERDRAILGNIFADFSWEVIKIAATSSLPFLLLEQPEDLGAMRYGPFEGQRPASMWQWPQFHEMLGRYDFRTCVFHQGNLGCDYPKPTRLWLRAKPDLPGFCYEGPPSFDKSGFYLGPLPLAKGMGSIRNRKATGPFQTSGTECWPARMCQWIAALLVESQPPPATTATKEDIAETAMATESGHPVCEPEGSRLLGGRAPLDTARFLAFERITTMVAGYAPRGAGLTIGES